MIERLVSILLLHTKLWTCLILNGTFGVLHFFRSSLSLLELSFNSSNGISQFVAALLVLDIFLSIVFVAKIIKKIKLDFNLCIDKKVQIHFYTTSSSYLQLLLNLFTQISTILYKKLIFTPF